MIPAALAVVLAAGLSLHGGAQLVDDDRPVARIRVGGYYTNDSVQGVGTLAFRDLLAAHAGLSLEVCVRSHATKRGALVVTIPRAVDEILEIPTRVGSRYRTRCAPFTVLPSPTWRPGFVQVGSTGVLGRVDRIGNVSIREGDQ